MFVRVPASDLPDPVTMIGTGIDLPPDYPGTSYATVLSGLIALKVFGGASIEDFYGAELTKAELTAYAALRFSPEKAASWKRFGFTPETTAVWRKTGVRTPAAAGYLVELGVTVEDYEYYATLRRPHGQSRNTADEIVSAVGRWQRSFPEVTDLREALRWHSTGLTPKAIHSLVHSGYAADRVIDVIRRHEIGTEGGIRYALTKEGTDSFDPALFPWVEDGWTPKKAVLLRSAGFTPLDADRMSRSYTYPELSIAKKDGILGYLASAWNDPSEARRLLAAGVTVEKANELYLAGVTDTDLIIEAVREGIPTEWAAAYAAGSVIEPTENPISPSSSYLTFA